MHKQILSITAGAAALTASPVQARYLQTDPVGYEDQVNLYAYVSNDPINGVDPTGKYQCAEGVDCGKFENYRQNLILARDSFEVDSDDYNRIDGALRNIGEPGVEGMTIQEGGVNTQNSSVPAEMNGVDGVMTIYTPTLEANAAAHAIDVGEFGASVIGHEADTGHMQPLNSLSDRMNAEISGYTTEDAVNRGLGNKIGPTYDTFVKDRSVRIQNSAQGSVAAACRGSSHPSCK